VESLFGPWKFFALYLISGSVANGATFLLNVSPFSLGSSGSTFGLLGALTGYILRNKQLLGKRSSFLLTGIQRNIIMNVLSGFMQPNIDNGAHIGGFAGKYFDCSLPLPLAINMHMTQLAWLWR
jgi:rhomboid protease GluP